MSKESDNYKEITERYYGRIIEAESKRFWLWCFLNEKKINKLTGYYNIHQRVDKIYALYTKERNDNLQNM